MTVQRFLEAVRRGDLHEVNALLEQEPALSEGRDEQGNSAIMLAAYSQRDAIIDRLRTSGVKLDLYEAAAIGAEEELEGMLKQRSESVSGYSHDGWTPLHLAAHFGHGDAAKLLLDHGADINARSRSPLSPGNTPLHAAVAGDHRDVVRLLMARGADLNAGQEGGYTPLHIAAASGLIEVLRELIDRGAQVNARDEQGHTPLALAMARDKNEVIWVLRQSGGKT